MTDPLPPHSIEAERAVLGAIMLRNVVLDEIDGILRAAEFYRDEHRILYEAMRALWDEDRSRIDPVTIEDGLATRGTLDDVGGMEVILDIRDACPSAANAEHYARIITQHARRRSVITVARDLIDHAHDPKRPIDDTIDHWEQAFGYDLQGGPTAVYTGADIVRDMLADTDAAEPQIRPGIPTGIIHLDSRLPGGGLPAGLVLVGATTSGGKTSFQAHCVAHAIGLGHKVVIFALEPKVPTLGRRILSSLSGVRIEDAIADVRRGDVRLADQDAVSRAAETVLAAALSIYGADTAPFRTLTSLIRRYVVRGECDIVWVDQISYVQPAESWARKKKVEGLERTAQELHILGEELGVPVCVLAQATVREGDGGRPGLKSWSWCQGLANPANVAIQLSRNRSDPEGEVVLGLVKNREGGTGEFPVTFQRHIAVFADAYEDRSQRPSERPLTEDERTMEHELGVVGPW